MKETRKIELGDFIEVPIWNAFGMVVGLELPAYGSENVQCVKLQEKVDSDIITRYTLEPEDFTFAD